MSRIFHRPMFRKGGSTGGITSGLREGFANGGYPNPHEDIIEKEYEFSDEWPGPGVDRPQYYAPKEEPQETEKPDSDFLRGLWDAPELPKSTAGSDFLMNLGLNLVSGPSTGNIWSNIGEAGKEPLGQFQKARAGERALKYQASQAERQFRFDIWKTLSKDEQDVYYKRAKMLVAQGKADTIGDALEILFPGTRKPAHEEDIARQAEIRAGNTRDENIAWWKKKDEDLDKNQAGNIIDFEDNLSTWLDQKYKYEGGQLYIDTDDFDKLVPNEDGSQLTVGEGKRLDNHDYKLNKIYLDSMTGNVYLFDGTVFTKVDLEAEEISNS